MRKTLIALSLTALFSTPVLAETLDERAQASRAAVQQFAGMLKGELQAGMKAGGPVQAIDVCHTRAPQIAQELSAKHGWSVARTSLKLRNPGNAPDAWETQVLNEFEARKAAGADPNTLEYSAVVDQDGRQVYRYMKAIPTGQVCLSCHGGDAVAPQVEAKLQQWYPHDQARGYQAGDLRGAFTLTKPL